MKPTVACLAGFLMLVLLAGCKGSADESGARENKGDIEASGTVSAAGREQNGKRNEEQNEEQKKALPEKLNVLYAANDGLYLIRVLLNGADDADDADAAVSTEAGRRNGYFFPLIFFGWENGRLSASGRFLWMQH